MTEKNLRDLRPTQSGRCTPEKYKKNAEKKDSLQSRFVMDVIYICKPELFPKDPWDWYIYLHLLDFYGELVGKYTSNRPDRILWG